jgi:hypothetical protein
MPVETTIHGLPQREPIGTSRVAILAPGYRGRVVQLDAPIGGGRATGDPLPLGAAAAAADAAVVTQFQVELESTGPAPGEGTRGAAAVEPRLFVPRQPDASYAVLQTDEDGRSRWIFPAEGTATESAFDLAAPIQGQPGQPGSGADDSRGATTAAMRRIVRVVAWLTDPIVGRTAQAIAHEWEERRRPHTLQQVTRDGHFVDPDWPTLTGGPALLLVHGTFSTPEAGFDGWLGTSTFGSLVDRYGGRCLALGHPSLSVSPGDNVDWLLDQLPAEFRGPVDVVCHSRGGLVTRVLCGAACRVPVRRACQVGAPNLGTPLADSSRWTAFLDSHTTALTTLPDSTTTIMLEGLLCVVKIVGTGVARGLPGLAAMEPDGEYLTTLAQQPLGGARWFTVGANFGAAQALSAGFASRIGDFVVDRFFSADNDLVVPTDGCHAPAGVTVVDSLRLSGGQVHHCNYFHTQDVHHALERWLA